MNVEMERQVRERRLTAVLEEVAGDGVPEGLAGAVLARVRAEPRMRSRRGATLLAALLMLGGIAVVVATALSRATVGEVPAQDPSPPSTGVPNVTITTATLRDACKPIDQVPPIDVLPPPGPGVARLGALAGRAPIGIVVVPGMHGESKSDLGGLTWREAIGSVAADLGTGVEDFGTMIVVGIGPAASAKRPRCTVSVKDLDVRDLGKVLHAKTGLNVVAAGDLAGRVTLDVDAVPARAVLDVVASRLGLEVAGCGSVLALRRATPAERGSPRVAPAFANEGEIRDLLDHAAHVIGANIVIDAKVAGSVYVSTNTANQDDLLAALAAGVGAEVQRLERGVLRVVPRLTSAEVTLVAEEMPDWPSWIELGDVRVTIEAPPSAVRIWTDDAQALDVLRAAAIASGHSFVRTDKGYTIR